jgi:comEA protein
MTEKIHLVDTRWQQDRRELVLDWLRTHWDACFLIVLLALIIGMVIVCLIPTPQARLSLQRYAEPTTANVSPIAPNDANTSMIGIDAASSTIAADDSALKPGEHSGSEGVAASSHSRKRAHFPKYHKKSDHPPVTSLNQGTAVQLQQLPGVGPKMAERIIAYRKAHGAFTDVAQIRDVKGIGNKKFEKIKPFIKL